MLKIAEKKTIDNRVIQLWLFRGKLTIEVLNNETHMLEDRIDEGVYGMTHEDILRIYAYA